jgi:ribonucleotide reductase alpha subunit
MNVPISEITTTPNACENSFKSKTIDELIHDAEKSGTYKDPYSEINFIDYHVNINDKEGKSIFDKNVIFPDYFSEGSAKIVASKYLCNSAKNEETDLRQMIDRVSDTITNWGIKDGYFLSEDEALEFNYKMKYYQIHQVICFNSPMYFNVGLDENPVLSACFILDVEDNMESITDWIKLESRIFMKGSGSGANLSKLRSSVERVRQGGFASGPVSFLKATDCQAGVIKSGGTFRRSAKMAVMNISHPDAPRKFITCKDKEEEKLRLLKAGGIEAEPGYELSDEVYFQNTNFSIRFPDSFMFAVMRGDKWETREVLTNDVVETFDAHQLLMDIAAHSHKTGDPGVMFHDNTNKWNSTIDDGEYDATNPCVVGDTLLRSPEGDFRIKDLVESGRTEIPVYCCDPKTGEVHIRIGRNPRKTGENKPVYKVTYSKGRGGVHSITTTANHKFLDIDGNVVECKDLVFETKGKTRLMPFNKLIETCCTSDKEAYIVLNVEYVGEEDVYNITVDEFHTVAWNDIITKNCGEFCGHPYESCNLTASNVVKFYEKDGRLNYEMLEDCVRTLTIAQDIVVDNASYPSEKIAETTKKYRSLGQGFTNLGGLFMFLGFPYDSDEARTTASIISALITGIAHRTSMEIADRVGPGLWWTSNEKNQESFSRVLNQHYEELKKVQTFNNVDLMNSMAHCMKLWEDLISDIRPSRNSQVTLSAPNGTTSFLVGATTSGPEPGFSIISYKTLSGNNGAQMKIVNDIVKRSLQRLDYDNQTVDNIIHEIVEQDIAIENSKFIKPEHIPIFDTSLAPANGTRAIDYMGHVKMLCAIQPFISGAISKTVNMANNCTVQDIYDLYFYAWKAGLKSITIYRDGSKTEQVLNTSDKSKINEKQIARDTFVGYDRKKMPIDRNATIHKFTINGNIEGYLTCGMYESGELGEIFITLSKDTPTLRGWADALATITSLALQSGVSLELLVDKMIRRRFAPAGFTTNKEIRQCNSIIDYIFKFIAFKYLSKEQLDRLNLVKTNADTEELLINDREIVECPICSIELVKLGTCFTCSGCGYNSGSCG